MIVQFSEGELAHEPGHQDIRRRLLESVLDYYEEFRARHEDDPAARADLTASRERAVAILAELARLRGLSLLAVVREKAVQEDLGLSTEQRAKVASLEASFERNTRPPDESFRPGPRDKGRAFPAASVVSQAIDAILTTPQRRRFQQVLLQVQQQGRNGFSDPAVADELSLTRQQRAAIRSIQNETHRAWADHLFSDRRLADPAAFWADAQTRVLAVLDAPQQAKWRELAGPPVDVGLREGYPGDGRNLVLPRPGPSFAFPRLRGTGQVVIAHLPGAADFGGSGFGHRRFADDRQGYAWRGNEIPPTVFEVGVSCGPLSTDEMPLVVPTGDPALPVAAGAPSGWVTLFRSADAADWDTDTHRDSRFAIPLARADERIRYLRLTRTDTGEALIVPITRARLAQAATTPGDHEFAWHGKSAEKFGGRHLGIAQGPGLGGAPPEKDRWRKGQKPPL
jgi:hypothetical protein